MEWTFKDAFAARVKRYQDETGKRQVEVAYELGLNISSLRNYLYGSKKPGTKVLQRAAALFGCSILEFMDDPGQELAGSPTSSMSEQGRLYAAMMVEKLMSDVLSDEDRRFLYQDFLMSFDRLQLMKSRGKG